MSPLAEGVFSGFLLRGLGRITFDRVIGEDNRSSLDKKFVKVIDLVSNRMQENYPDLLGGSIDTYFNEPLILEELMKLLFREDKIDIEKLKVLFDVNTMPDTFLDEYIYELKRELSKYHEFERIFADTRIHSVLFEMNDRLNLIAKNMESNDNKLDLIEFYEGYKKIAIRNLIKINYFGLGLSPSVKRGEKTLNDIYVKPFFKIRTAIGRKEIAEYSSQEQEELSINEIFSTNEDKNLVILGKPGAGKSLLGKYLMCSIFNKDTDEIPDSIMGYLPFRIELRKYLPYKRSMNANIISYLKYILKTEFYISYITEQNITNILDNEKVLFIFDGLDEIFNIQDKIEVKNDIENFLETYKKCKGLVTSRHIGYDEANLDGDNFTELEILDFEDDQIEEYVRRWYECEVKIDEKIEKEITSFLEHVEEIDEELIRNPLLLSLIVILYRNNGKLPSSKLEIYRSCTKTLVDKWDETKKLDISLKVENKKRSIFSFLALWQYETLSQESQEMIDYEKVLKEVEAIIQQKLNLTEDAGEAEIWAEEFLEYAKNRSLYFDNDFTHKTFMEYFTAYCIYQTTDIKLRPQKRDDIIRDYIKNPFWFIVLELLINLIDENQPDNEIIDDIIRRHTVDQNEAYVFFLHILKTVKNVSEDVIESLVKDSILLSINEINLDKEENEFSFDIVRKIRDLIHIPQYLEVVQRKYDEIFDEIKDDEELLLKYYIFGIEFDRRGLRHSNKLNIHNDIFINKLRLKNKYLFSCTMKEGDLTEIKTFISQFGVSDIFKPIDFVFHSKAMRAPVIDVFIHEQWFVKDEQKVLNNYKELLNLGIDKNRLMKALDRSYFRRMRVKTRKNIDAKSVELIDHTDILFEMIQKSITA
ncbi:NACHT domain-containing protein [Priestia aryabhattai]|uniref:NACHT domain-containing protein n=1 Tax=Priestia aryabhattai TaxID=412384 RepID=UPI0028819976|nr:NACHT domain-containing protein [Priestia aryabhattai]MDT0149848.1 NACHT domain-containing protein [Priestia aryabhattai]MDT0155401.1 NACHT domain-containing protein [Priestia aryabhattai]